MFIEKDHLKITCQNFSQNPYDFLRELRILGFKKEADSYSRYIEEDKLKTKNWLLFKCNEVIKTTNWLLLYLR